MIGGYIYNSSFKKKSLKKSKTKSSRNLGGKKSRKYKYHKKTHLKKHKKHRKKNRKNKSRRKQRGGSMLNYSYLSNNTPNTISERLPAGVYLNTVQGYGANLNNPPIEEFNTVKQCNNM